MILGPNLLDVVPLGAHDDEEGHHVPSAFALAGSIGVSLLIMESGMHLSPAKVLEVGGGAMLVALIGTLAPVALGVLLVWAMGYDVFPDGVAVGVALAPTSVGISMQMLAEDKAVNTLFGQTIVTAAFIDDVMSLLALVVLLQLAQPEISATNIALPLVYSVLFLVISVLLAMFAFPPAMRWILSHFSEDSTRKVQMRDMVHLGCMGVVLIAYATIGWLVGTHLLGAFLAGVSFVSVPRSGVVWRRQVKRVSSLLIKLFFMASVAFSIPVAVLFSPTAVWQGLVLGVAGALGGKLISALHLGTQDMWVVGWAMAARGEFAYLVAEVALNTEVAGSEGEGPGGGPRSLMNEQVYAAVIWAFLLCTVASPLAFKYVLQQRLAAVEVMRSHSIGPKASAAEERHGKHAVGAFGVRVEGVHRPGVLLEVLDIFRVAELEVVEANCETDGDLDVF